jgi:predicted DNA-binding transcriptional regulator YafY
MIEVEKLKDAIKNKKQIKINYRAMGIRTVLPAALYNHPSTGKLLIDAFQTDGYSESREVPGWKMFEVDEIFQLSLTEMFFSTIAGYNRLSKRYVNAIAQI